VEFARMIAQGDRAGGTNSVWTVAIYRFIEVSIGIAVGLVIAAVWPEREAGQAGAAT
jgi:uncharacterized membrane protein YccC